MEGCIDSSPPAWAAATPPRISILYCIETRRLATCVSVLITGKNRNPSFFIYFLNTFSWINVLLSGVQQNADSNQLVLSGLIQSDPIEVGNSERLIIKQVAVSSWRERSFHDSVAKYMFYLKASLHFQDFGVILWDFYNRRTFTLDRADWLSW